MGFINNPATVNPDDLGNIKQWNGVDVAAATSTGLIPIVLRAWGSNNAVPSNLHSGGYIDANVAAFQGDNSVLAPNAAGQLQTDVVAWRGNQPSALTRGLVNSDNSSATGISKGVTTGNTYGVYKGVVATSNQNKNDTGWRQWTQTSNIPSTAALVAISIGNPDGTSNSTALVSAMEIRLSTNSSGSQQFYAGQVQFNDGATRQQGETIGSIGTSSFQAAFGAVNVLPVPAALGVASTSLWVRLLTISYSTSGNWAGNVEMTLTLLFNQ